MDGVIVPEHFVICAFRYALGRQTYVVSEVVEWLKYNFQFLSDFHKSLIKKETQEAIDRGIISDIDLPWWQSVLQL